VRGWLDTGRLPRAREQRAFLLSSARALAFNAVLAARVAGGTWNRLLPGEVINLSGSQSVFASAYPDDGLQKRLLEGDVAPTGPLCGAGGVCRRRSRPHRIRRTRHGRPDPVAARVGRDARRATRTPVRPVDLRHRLDADALELEFALPRGGFATSVLREILDARVPESGAD
jgi:tRNA pseudouridine13 synthase